MVESALCVCFPSICVLCRNVDWALCSFVNWAFSFVRIWVSCVFWILGSYLMFSEKYLLNPSGLISIFNHSFAKHKFCFVLFSPCPACLFLLLLTLPFVSHSNNLCPPQCKLPLRLASITFKIFCPVFYPWGVDSYVKGKMRV